MVGRVPGLLVRRLLPAALIGAGLLASALGSHARSDSSHANDFIVLFPVELGGVVLSGIAAAHALFARRDQARAMLGVGLYLVVVAGAIGTLLPAWLPQDNTILGSALLAGLLAAAGTGLASISTLILVGSPSTARLVGAGSASAVGALLVVMAGGMVSPLAQLRLPLLVAALVGLSVLLPTRRQWRRLAWPLLLMLGGGAVTLAALVMRGPGDWASASDSVRLYSFPILLMALGISLTILMGWGSPPSGPWPASEPLARAGR